MLAVEIVDSLSFRAILGATSRTRTVTIVQQNRIESEGIEKENNGQIRIVNTR